MSEVFRLVSLHTASRNLNLPDNLSRHTKVQYLLQINGISVSIPYIPTMHKVWLTANKY